MEFTNTFTVTADADRVFAAMLDVPAVAGCLPGATVGDQTTDGGYTASITVKVGPVKLTYHGEVRVAQSDPNRRAATLTASGRAERGQGSAEAQIGMTVDDGVSASTVTLTTDLAVTGRVAQMGAGIMQEVANAMVGDFAACLQTRLAASEPSKSSDEDSAAAHDRTSDPTGELSEHVRRATELKALPLLFRALKAKLSSLVKKSRHRPDG